MKAEWPSANLRFVRPVAIALLAATGGISAWQMLRIPLWGWWPLPLLLSFWLTVMLIFLPADRVKRKWLAISTLSGVLLGVGFPPSPATWVIMAAWIPLLFVENDIYGLHRKPRPGQVFFYSFHAFALWNIIATFWVINTAFAAGIIANFLNAALMATVMVIIHLLRHRLPGRWMFPVFASGWISFEYLHHIWELSWPWLTLGNSLAQYPWAVQWYEYTGAFGGSAWILGLNFLGYKLFMRWKGDKPLAPLAWKTGALLLIPLALSLWKWYSVEASNNLPVNVTVVQPNFEPHYEKFDLPQEIQLRRFLRLSLEHIDSTTRYLVFPETSFEGIRLNTLRENPAIRIFQGVVDSFPQVRLVAGISSFRIHEKKEAADIAYRTHISSGGDTTYLDVQNAAIQLSSGGAAAQVYFKSKLVPGPEIFPFRKLLFFLKPVVDKLGGSYEGHTMQKERSVFTGGPLTVAPVICYESIYGDYMGGYVRNGATAFFIVTNDGWWDNTPGHIQHLKLGALRAIEHRRPIARSANTGISAFIDIRGRIHQPTAYGEATAIEGEVIPETRITFYTRWGDLVVKISAVLLAICLMIAIFTRPKSKTAL